MDEQKIFMVELDGLFPEFDEAPRVYGTAGEILERIAKELGLEDGDSEDLDLSLESIYPSSRAYRAQQAMEDRLQNADGFVGPDELITAMIKEGLIRTMSDDEFDEFQDENEMNEYESARSGLDEEWQDGLWET